VFLFSWDFVAIFNQLGVSCLIILHREPKKRAELMRKIAELMRQGSKPLAVVKVQLLVGIVL